MPSVKFSKPFLDAFQTDKTQVELFDAIENGLGIRIGKGGSKSFFYRYRKEGNLKRFNIGKYPGVSLADARKRVRELRSKVEQGDDPQFEKLEKKQTKKVTLDEVFILYKKYHLPNNRPKTQIEYQRIYEKHIKPNFGSNEIKLITKREINELLDNIATDLGHGVLSNRVKATLSSIFGFAEERDYIQINIVKAVKKKYKEVSKDVVLNLEELKRVWKALENRPIISAAYFKILLLTGQRRSETVQMKWGDISDDIWTIPAADTKVKRKQQVIFSELSMNLIEQLRPITGSKTYVFSSEKDVPRRAKWILTQAQLVQKDANVLTFTPHNLRRTFATILGELGYSRMIIGMLLNHKTSAGQFEVTAIYDRNNYLTERREAIVKLSDYFINNIIG